MAVVAKSAFAGSPHASMTRQTSSVQLDLLPWPVDGTAGRKGRSAPSAVASLSSTLLNLWNWCSFQLTQSALAFGRTRVEKRGLPSVQRTLPWAATVRFLRAPLYA